MEYIVNSTPYDSNLDIEKTTTCTNESLNVTYQYTKDKALYNYSLNKNTLNENSDSTILVENEQNLFWLCPKCKELNDCGKAQCQKCGYVQVILT